MGSGVVGARLLRRDRRGLCQQRHQRLGEFVAPVAARARDEIYNRRIQRLADNTDSERADITYLGQGGRIASLSPVN